MIHVDYRSSHLGKGEDYHRIFQDEPHTAMTWALERREIDHVVQAAFPARPPRHLDFACGTGRILRHLAPSVRSSVGVDVSESMLSIARTQNPGARLLLADMTRQDVLPGEQFELITAFRFFPNAEPSLREEAMAAVVRHLAPSGLLLFNNHLNQDSLHNGVLRASGRALGHAMTMAECDDLLSNHGLVRVRARGIGFIPTSDRVFARFATPLSWLERPLARSGWIAHKAQNVLLVAHPA